MIESIRSEPPSAFAPTMAAARHAIDGQHGFVHELGWRACFRHACQHRGDDILRSLNEGLLPVDAYAHAAPADIRQADTRVPVVDEAVRTLHATGMLRNHARMWLASCMVPVRKVRWRVAADGLCGHLIDGDLASNHLGWQWVAATGSGTAYLFNADNVARYAPGPRHSLGSVIDTTYAALDRMARGFAPPDRGRPRALAAFRSIEPGVGAEPPAGIAAKTPDAAAVADRDVWLAHPWSLGDLPSTLPEGAVAIGTFVADFHRAWPGSERRWNLVGARMAKLTSTRWRGDAEAIGAALKAARSARSIDEPHLAPRQADRPACDAGPDLFPRVERRCDSFSTWWKHAIRGLEPTAGPQPACETIRSER